MHSATVTIRVSRDEAARLRRLADATKRSVSYLGHEAILRYLESEEWQVAAVQEAIDAIDAGEPLVPHERVKPWLRSLGTAGPLPRPR
jgi:predicted transcriptional regulator